VDWVRRNASRLLLGIIGAAVFAIGLVQDRVELAIAVVRRAGETVNIEVSATVLAATRFRRVIPGRLPG